MWKFSYLNSHYCANPKHFSHSGNLWLVCVITPKRPHLVKSCNYPPCACAARGKVISRGVQVSIKNLQFFWNQSFISQNTHFQSSISTLLIEFNGLWYSSEGQQVFVAIAKPNSLSFWVKVDNAKNTNIASAPNWNQRLQTTPLR